MTDERLVAEVAQVIAESMHMMAGGTPETVLGTVPNAGDMQLAYDVVREFGADIQAGRDLQGIR